MALICNSWMYHFAAPCCRQRFEQKGYLRAEYNLLLRGVTTVERTEDSGPVESYRSSLEMHGKEIRSRNHLGAESMPEEEWETIIRGMNGRDTCWMGMELKKTLISGQPRGSLMAWTNIPPTLGSSYGSQVLFITHFSSDLSSDLSEHRPLILTHTPSSLPTVCCVFMDVILGTLKTLLFVNYWSV